MAAGVIGLVGRLRAALGPDAADAELVRAYARHADTGAFAALVRRHGPMVWATCRRTAGDHHAAEDAFQATFLVLARKAGGLRPAHSLGGWLHAVAVNVSVRARTAADRRRRREGPAAEVAAPTPPEPPDERALAALDEEVERLPARLREAVVLCELEGLPRKEAAARLGVPEGTLSSRLAAARKRLADRLRARGVTPELLAVPAAAVPAGLAEAACGLGAGGVPAPAVLALAGGAMRAMLLKALGVGLVACGLLAAGGRAGDEPPAKPAGPQPAVAKAPREGVIVLSTFGRKGDVVPVERFKPDGTPLGKVDTGDLTHLWQPRVSPDGTKLLAAHLLPISSGGGVFTKNRHVLLDLTTPGTAPEPFGPTVYRQSAVWSRDGRRVYGTSILETAKAFGETPRDKLPNRGYDLLKPGAPLPLGSWVYDVAAKTRTPLALPDGHQIADLSPDGTTLLTVRPKWREAYPLETYTMPLATLEPKRLTEAGFEGWRFSLDGRRVIGRTVTSAGPDKPPVRTGLGTVPVAGGPVAEVWLPEEVRHVRDAVWSPDGRRIAYAWEEPVPWPQGLPKLPLPIGMDKWPDKTSGDRLSVADADGRNPQVIVRREPGGGNLQGLDWH